MMIDDLIVVMLLLLFVGVIAGIRLKARRQPREQSTQPRTDARVHRSPRARRERAASA